MSRSSATQKVWNALVSSPFCNCREGNIFLTIACSFLVIGYSMIGATWLQGFFFPISPKVIFLASLSCFGLFVMWKVLDHGGKQGFLGPLATAVLLFLFGLFICAAFLFAPGEDSDGPVLKGATKLFLLLMGLPMVLGSGILLGTLFLKFFSGWTKGQVAALGIVALSLGFGFHFTYHLDHPRLSPKWAWRSDRWGIVNAYGVWFVPPLFSRAPDLTRSPTPVCIGKTWGYLEPRAIQPGTFSWLVFPRFTAAESFRAGVAWVQESESWQLINLRGKLIGPRQSEKSARLFRWKGISPPASGTIILCEGPSGFGFIDTDGKEVIPLEYQKGHRLEGRYPLLCKNSEWYAIDFQLRPQKLVFGNGLALLKVGGKCGYINVSGAWALPPHFPDAGHFSEGLAAVKTGKTWKFINPQGTRAVRGSFADVGLFSQGLCPAKAGEWWGFIDRRGRWHIKPVFSSARSFAERLAPVRFPPGKTLSAILGKPLEMTLDDPSRLTHYSFPDYQTPHNAAGLWGYIDESGTLAIPPVAVDAFPFRQGLAYVKIEFERPPPGMLPDGSGAYCEDFFITRTGRFVTDPGLFERYRHGLAPIRIGTRWGYLTDKGMMAIPPVFAQAGPFRNDLAKVAVARDARPDDSGNETHIGVINKFGRFVLVPAALGQQPRLQIPWSVETIDVEGVIPQSVFAVDDARGRCFIDRDGRYLQFVAEAQTRTPAGAASTFLPLDSACRWPEPPPATMKFYPSPVRRPGWDFSPLGETGDPSASASTHRLSPPVESVELEELFWGRIGESP